MLFSIISKKGPGIEFVAGHTWDRDRSVAQERANRNATDMLLPLPEHRTSGQLARLVSRGQKRCDAPAGRSLVANDLHQKLEAIGTGRR